MESHLPTFIPIILTVTHTLGCTTQQDYTRFEHPFINRFFFMLYLPTNMIIRRRLMNLRFLFVLQFSNTWFLSGKIVWKRPDTIVFRIRFSNTEYHGWDRTRSISERFGMFQRRELFPNENESNASGTNVLYEMRAPNKFSVFGNQIQDNQTSVCGQGLTW